jgi:hypothetical protein
MFAFLAIKLYIRFCGGTTYNLDSIYVRPLRVPDLQDALSYKTQAPPLCGTREVLLVYVLEVRIVSSVIFPRCYSRLRLP